MNGTNNTWIIPCMSTGRTYALNAESSPCSHATPWGQPDRSHARSMTCVALSDDRRLPPRRITADACETEADRRELQRREAWRLRICRLAAPFPLVMARWTELDTFETTISRLVLVALLSLLPVLCPSLKHTRFFLSHVFLYIGSSSRRRCAEILIPSSFWSAGSYEMSEMLARSIAPQQRSWRRSSKIEDEAALWIAAGNKHPVLLDQQRATIGAPASHNKFSQCTS
jgi:hypothetical protein